MSWIAEALRASVRLFRSDDPGETKIALLLVGAVASAFAYQRWVGK
jgi:hypothetical protein